MRLLWLLAGLFTASVVNAQCGTWGGDSISWRCGALLGDNGLPISPNPAACSLPQACGVLEQSNGITAPSCACTSCSYDAVAQACTSTPGSCQLDHACTLVEPAYCTCMPGTPTPPAPVTTQGPPTPVTSATPATPAPATGAPAIEPEVPLGLIIGLSLLVALIVLLCGLSAVVNRGRDDGYVRLDGSRFEGEARGPYGHKKVRVTAPSARPVTTKSSKGSKGARQRIPIV